jgi:hypothetical protein
MNEVDDVERANGGDANEIDANFGVELPQAPHTLPPVLMH